MALAALWNCLHKFCWNKYQSCNFLWLILKRGIIYNLVFLIEYFGVPPTLISPLFWFQKHCVCCVLFWKVPSWNMFQICTVQTSSYRSRMLNTRSWSIKMCAKRPHVRQAAFCLFVCLFVCLFFSNKCRATSNLQWVKKTYCCLPSIWQSLHGANLIHVSEIHIFSERHTGQSETCFRMARVSEWHATCAQRSPALGWHSVHVAFSVTWDSVGTPHSCSI